mmetsp:Transcript_46063/g.99458  ORF Transcript_46063/g.99458 Transcript_46063/m.99458 type:complete len:85 (-) Transcript_46063:666-920(-)
MRVCVYVHKYMHTYKHIAGSCSLKRQADAVDGDVAVRAEAAAAMAGSRTPGAGAAQDAAAAAGVGDGVAGAAGGAVPSLAEALS